MAVADQAIPIYTNLTDLYGNLGASLNHAERWNNLAKEFENRFGRPPAYITRAPGRVNLIGEHIDYALFGVLPAAIERDILIACAPRGATNTSLEHVPAGGVFAENLNPKYSRQIFAPGPKPKSDDIPENVHAEQWHLDINTKELRWESYVKAGYYGVLSHYFTAPGGLISLDSGTVDRPIPVDLLITGSVPAGAGLSSSAAMVVASTLAFLAVNNKLDQVEASGIPPLNKGALVSMAMENEKRVGVNSGGMDQAASVMSDPSSALYITFHPQLTASRVPLPPHAVFVCANSLVVSDKAVTAKHRYNLRVVETLVGARILARDLGVKVGERERVTYRDILGRLVGENEGRDMGTEALMVALENIGTKLDVLKPPPSPSGAEKNREELGVTMEEMIQMSGLSPEVFQDVYLSWVDVEATRFQIYKRAKHVFSEAHRVLQFRRVCLDTTALTQDVDVGFGIGITNVPYSSPPPPPPSAVAAGTQTSAVPELPAVAAMEQLGRLMNDSQISCEQLFECSCPELDLLTRLAREAGAYGSRLTGAGWGGCTVSLVAEAKVGEFIKQIKATYPPYKDLEGEEALNEVIFATRPSSGACVYKFE